jgi:hypothetical protein
MPRAFTNLVDKAGKKRTPVETDEKIVTINGAETQTIPERATAVAVFLRIADPKAGNSGRASAARRKSGSQHEEFFQN